MPLEIRIINKNQYRKCDYHRKFRCQNAIISMNRFVSIDLISAAFHVPILNEAITRDFNSTRENEKAERRKIFEKLPRPRKKVFPAHFNLTIK